MSDTDPDNRHVDREAGQEAKRAAERLGEDARATAEDLSARAQHEAQAQAERAKSGVASEMSGIADALRRAADDMRSGSPQEKTFGQIAASLADASEAVRDRDLGELATDASDFARRNPLAFLGGAALAGFAVSRFAKASASKPRSGRGSGHSDPGVSGDPYASDGPATGAGTVPPISPDRSAISRPATTPVTGTPGTGTAATGTIDTTATKIPGER